MTSVKGLCEYAAPEEEFTNRTILDDLQLAAELGKTLLERNKELENALKQSQSIVEDQLQEIEYLTKQSAALREVNDSRLRIYEQLEVSIQDLERANHRLVLENSSERKRVKSLTATIEQLETKNEELLATVDDLRLQVDLLKRKESQKSELVTSCTSPVGNIQPIREILSPDSTTHSKKQFDSPFPSKEQKTEEKSTLETDNNDAIEEITQLMTQLREMKMQYSKEQRKVVELEEQLTTVLQQNQALENQIIKLHHNDEDAKSMHEELSILEEVRLGQMCSKCLQNKDLSSNHIPEDDSSLLDELINPVPQYTSAYNPEVQDYQKSSSPTQKQAKNQYKELVEKYEALFEDNQTSKNQYMSLQDELRLSGDYTITQKEADEESGHEDASKKRHITKENKITYHTPTDFSEAETSSSGFADETSSKYTQTEGTGSFLCTLADGEEKFSIYDDTSPIEVHFQKRPQYRELFKEIFTVLKKTAENKEEGKDIVSLNETNVSALNAITSSDLNDTLTNYHDIPDDTESIVSSTMSIPASIPEQTHIIENIIEAQNQIPQNDSQVKEDFKPSEPVLRPLIRQNFDYLTKENKKRSSRRKHRHSADRSDSPVTHIIGSPKITFSSRPNSGRRRKELKNASAESENLWNGNSLQFYNTRCRSKDPSPAPSLSSEKAYEFKPSVASQEMRKLKNLDRSYAEVLKLGEGRKRESRRGKFSNTNHW